MKLITAVVAAGILLGMAGQQVAYAQLPTVFDLQLGEAMSFGEDLVVAQALSFERTLSEALGISDALDEEAVIAQISLERTLSETIGISDALANSFEDGSPETFSVSVGDTLTIQEGESVSKQAASSGSGSGSGGGGGAPGSGGKVARSVSDELSIEEKAKRDRDRMQEPPAEPRLEERSVTDGFGIEESVFLSGSIVPPAPPQLSASGGQQMFNMESAEAAVITFISSSSGTYGIAIEDEAGERVATVSGQMAEGENNARWTGADSKGEPVPDGTYTYFITANNDVGTRAPPGEGDGTIVVSGSPAVEAQAPVDWTLYAIIVPVAAAGGTGALLFSRRRNKLIVYLPAGATPVIDEIRERYPRAAIEEYVSPHDGGSELIKGVAIPDPKSSDEEWFGDIIKRAKELAGVDSINISHKGKVRPV